MKFVTVLLIFLSSCASLETYKELPLEKQILKYRSGFKGLTHRYCDKYNEKGECLLYAVKEYDLTEPDNRKLLRDLSFICKIAHKRYKILKDEPLFANDDYYKCGFLNLKRCRKRNVINVTKTTFLIQANTKCFSYKNYSFDSI